jgi:hypothetical protein
MVRSSNVGVRTLGFVFLGGPPVSLPAGLDFFGFFAGLAHQGAGKPRAAFRFGFPGDAKYLLRYCCSIDFATSAEMRRASGSGAPSIKELENLRWLKAPQLSKLAKALSVSWAEKREIVFDEGSSPDTTYYSAVRSGANHLSKPQRPSRCGDHAGARDDSILSAASDRHQL